MSINVTFYNFSKRQNSTALPTSATASSVVAVLLKDDCEQEAPVLEISSTDPDNYYNYNYCYIPFFNRYYFVSKREVTIGKLLYVYLQEDYLASFKSPLLLSSGFVKYSYNMGSTSIIDSRIPRSTAYTVGTASADFPQIIASRSYWVSMVGESRTVTYNVSKSDLDSIFGSTSYSNRTMTHGSDEKDAINNFGDMLSSIVNDYFTENGIFKYLRSAYVLPLQADEEVLGASRAIIAGHRGLEVTGKPLVEPVFSQAVAVSIPWQVSDWRRCSPFTSVYLYLPLFGVISIDTNTITASSYLTVKYSISYSDGALSYSVEDESNRIIATGQTNVRSEYGIGTSNTSMGGGSLTGQLASGGASIAGFLSGGAFNAAKNAVSGSIQSIMGDTLNSVAGVLDSFGQGFSTSGGLGGLSACGLETRFKCYTITKNLTDVQSNFATAFGYPVMKYMAFSSCTGFLQTQDFYFEYSTASLNELEKISSLLNTGIYIE